MKVKYIGCDEDQVNFGNCADPRVYLKIGEYYEVKDKHIHSYHTKLFLVGYEGLGFNSVCFEEEETYTTTFDKNNHIIGKVYDLNQKNMCLMLDYIDELRSFINAHEFYTAKEFECMKRDICEGECDVCGGNAK